MAPRPRRLINPPRWLLRLAQDETVPAPTRAIARQTFDAPNYSHQYKLDLQALRRLARRIYGASTLIQLPVPAGSTAAGPPASPVAATVAGEPPPAAAQAPAAPPPRLPSRPASPPLAEATAATAARAVAVAVLTPR
ncbi:hypothetical protein I4F81_000706 [Pyropia yezoensis]|uniref:Uncharacterized protein n=1 Tax=Pyropia yezoensis TaxID=2788 RepID=A0ACC3BKG0_PYRYE|nr:hypothetical protein I4F81_000706 [Neopyropia yezoensis]